MTFSAIPLALARHGRGRGVIINEHVLTAAQTRFHVDVLSRWFEFVHHDELADRMSRGGGDGRARPFCLFTFDDGKRSNATAAAAELTRLGVPAAFYVTTGFIDGACVPLWFDRYEALLRATGAAPAGMERETLKRLPFAELTERLDRACHEHGVTANLDDDDVRPMSWDEARDLARRGFTIGAHGLRHAILTTLATAEAEQEIAGSVAAVTERIGAPCRSFAFPNGNSTPHLARFAQQCGVETVMTTEPTWIGANAPLWRLPRVQLFGEFTASKIELKVALAATSLLKRLGSS